MKTAGLGESVETRQAVSQLTRGFRDYSNITGELDEAESYNARKVRQFRKQS